MKKLYFLFLFCCASANSTITPEILLPAGSNQKQFQINTIGENSPIQYIQQNSSCNDAKYKNFYVPAEGTNSVDELSPGKIPFAQWFCLYATDIYEDGYGPGLAEGVSYSKTKSLWIKKKNKKTDISPAYLNTPYKPIDLYNISSPNSKGFAIISRNILISDRELSKNSPVKKIIYFCMIRDTEALCGVGSLVHNINGQEIDFTPYALKSLESMEIGIH